MHHAAQRCWFSWFIGFSHLLNPILTRRHWRGKNFNPSYMWRCFEKQIQSDFYRFVSVGALDAKIGFHCLYCIICKLNNSIVKSRMMEVLSRIHVANTRALWWIVLGGFVCWHCLLCTDNLSQELMRLNSDACICVCWWFCDGCCF